MVEIVRYDDDQKAPDDVTQYAARLFLESIFPDRKITDEKLAEVIDRICKSDLDVLFADMGEVLGACSSYELSGLLGKTLCIDRMAIARSVRNRGFGAGILNHMAVLSLNNNISRIVLNTGGHPDRNRFYERSGFVRQNEEGSLYSAPPNAVRTATELVFLRPPGLPRSS